MNEMKLKKAEEKITKISVWFVVICNTVFGIFANLEDKIFQVLSSILKGNILFTEIDIENFVTYITSAMIIFISYEILKSYKHDTNDSKKLVDMLKQEIGTNRSINQLDVFAYSSLNYINYINENNIQVEKLNLLLKRYSDDEVYLIKNKSVIQNYHAELSSTIAKAQKLEQEGKIKKLEIRFFDFEPYSHFMIINSCKVIAGNLIHTYNSSKMRKGNVKLFRSEDYQTVKSYKDLFETHFKNASAFSGTKNYYQNNCPTCDAVSGIINGFSPQSNNFEACNFAVIPADSFKDFLLMPDQLPLSEYHLLLVTKFHILSLFQYLKHEKNYEEVENLINKLDKKIFDITNQHILVFEHGSNFEDSKFSGKSIDHMHLHILLNENNIDLKKAIELDDKGIIDFNNHNSFEEFDNLKDFSTCQKAGISDYFLVWDFSSKNKKIQVFFPQKQESQYLRRVYFSQLSDANKIDLKLSKKNQKNSFKNGYDWRKNSYTFSVNDKERYTEFGEKIKFDW